MNDTKSVLRPDHQALFATASAQAGYFTTSQALAHGFSSALLTYHTKAGRFLRLTRSLYRLRDYPSAPREEVVAAWLRQAPDAVVSHESALDLLSISDVIPDRIHLTVSRARRKLVPQPGVTFHTTKHPFGPGDVIDLYGVRVTSAARTLVDLAAGGAAPDLLGAATAEALRRGLTTEALLRTAGRSRGARVERLWGVNCSGSAN